MFRELLLHRKIRREINGTLEILVSTLGIPREYLDRGKLRIKFARGSRIDGAASYKTSDGNQVLTVDPEFPEFKVHELGHYIFFNVAARGDPGRREEFHQLQRQKYLQFQERYKDLAQRFSRTSCFSPGQILPMLLIDRDEVMRVLSEKAPVSLVHESYAAFCALIVDEDFFPAFRAFRRFSEEQFDSMLYVSSSIFDREDTDIAMDLLKNFLPQTAYEQAQGSEHQEKTVGIGMMALKILDGYLHACGEYLASKMMSQAKERGLQTVSDQVLGIGKFENLPAEVRVGTPEYDSERHLVYLTDSFLDCKADIAGRFGRS